VVRVTLTFTIFSTTLAIFRAQSIESGLTMWSRMFRLAPGSSTPLHLQSLVVIALVVLVCQLIVRFGWWKKLASRLPAMVMGGGYAVVVTLAMLLAPETDKLFIYFQF
jgi:alginate O-acetyltransferase complex protein AlgI